MRSLKPLRPSRKGDSSGRARGLPPHLCGRRLLPWWICFADCGKSNAILGPLPISIRCLLPLPKRANSPNVSPSEADQGGHGDSPSTLLQNKRWPPNSSSWLPSSLCPHPWGRPSHVLGCMFCSTRPWNTPSRWSKPAGFGKTTLLSTWAQSLAREAKLWWLGSPSMRMTMNPHLFWTYLLSALHRQGPQYFEALMALNCNHPSSTTSPASD